MKQMQRVIITCREEEILLHPISTGWLGCWIRSREKEGERGCMGEKEEDICNARIGGEGGLFNRTGIYPKEDRGGLSPVPLNHH